MEAEKITFVLSQKDLDDFVSLIYLGNYFSNGYKPPHEKNKSFENLFLMICEKYKNEKEKKEPNEKFFDVFCYLHDKNLRYIDEYSDLIFYDLLAHKLADLKALQLRQDKMFWYERYIAELQLNGLTKIIELFNRD